MAMTGIVTPSPPTRRPAEAADGRKPRKGSRHIGDVQDPHWARRRRRPRPRRPWRSGGRRGCRPYRPQAFRRESACRRASASTLAPSAARPSAITPIRSLSLTLSSAAPDTVVSPSASAAATNSAGNSSMASGTSSGGTVMPCKRAGSTRRSATGSPPASLWFRNSIRPPIRRRISTSPVRVALTPTLRMSSGEAPAIVAATMKNAADEKSPGTSIRVPRRTPGVTDTRPPSTRDLDAECAQHPLRVVPGDRWLGDRGPSRSRTGLPEAGPT